ncbi:MAG: xanthine dehydrogenase family protein subunit M [Bryobacterales bacterium]|nr:xanthine dehydrogenase family protein subunit M [Bryobacterales bacterium]MBV9397534.1 xanthine dehydrogenase family protein subunit M [Bryobacterales bacterium]
MKTFTNVNPKSVQEAVKLLGQQGKTTAVVGGGSDLLGMVKERLIQPDILVNLKTIPGLDKITEQGGEVRIGGLTTLATISQDPTIRSRYKVLADAAGAVGTPQIRNAGTIAGNVSQRPWCWYFRNGFPCFKNGGKTCFSIAGENEFHAIFGGGPSYIVHPSDTAPALVALDAKFRIAGPAGERTIAASEFFAPPSKDPSRENVLAHDEVLVEIHLPAAPRGLRSTYHKELDRESWTHAIVSVAVALEMDRDFCKKARVVLGGVAPIPWRLPKVEAMLAGKRITPELAAQAGAASIEGAQPLAKNKYKLPLTKAIVKRTLTAVAA